MSVGNRDNYYHGSLLVTNETQVCLGLQKIGCVLTTNY
jgi:hypothetical protein